MAKGFNVLFVSSEVYPYSKTGGLADVSNSLPQALNSLGNEVRIITPKYGPLDERRLQIHEIKRLKDIGVDVDGKSCKFNIKSSFIHGKNTKAQVYLLENQDFFKNKGVYQNIRTKKDFPNNDERFTFFCKAVLDVLEILQWKPDVIHCNDWQTGLIPAYIKTLYKDNPHIKDIKTVFTIHNLAYQGNFPKTSFKKTGLPEEVLEKATHDGKFSFLKTGLAYADKITTVSQKYAEEIRTDKDYSCGMEKILDSRKSDLVGILNGIDHSVWNPSYDKVITYRYTYQEIPLKYENKRELLNKYKFEYSEDVPLIGMITRLVDQKGFDLMEKILPALMKEDIQLVILGTGDEKYHKFLKNAKKKYAKKLIVHLGFDEDLAHHIEAGCDMFIMPSKYEPCGLNQMYSLTYGTVPIVRDTGGLSDTVTDYKKPDGNGFLFEKYDSNELLKAVKTAIEVFKDKNKWYKIMRNGMALDFSWKVSAKKYMNLYSKLAK
ncbi:MAG: glycogen synthase GlgA [Ignavibacteriae bacterium]|nr:glycogen synthase GlgA [Ignavibacteriota bacterium]MCB0724780.1 glycogen synthase GlgA [Ignavibacteriota bacterium]MCB9242207.1 glycogen synthase GlgA [Ignavibacteriales bacterium]